MILRRDILVLACCGMTACHSTSSSGGVYAVRALNSGTTASFRGIAVVDADVAWASGTRGTVLRTTNGGATWVARSVPDADSVDLRDIAAFDSLTAYALAAGEDGRIYKTVNGGRTWLLQYRNRTSGAFFDCIDFWDAQHGIAMSDPVGDHLLFVTTSDGTHWSVLEPRQLPAVAKGEAAFAASGTCLVTAGSKRVYAATGGGAQSRVFVSNDRGNTWRAAVAPVPAGSSSAGIFSLALADANHVVAMGGDYQKPAQPAVVALTTNGGRSWTVAGKTSYVSGAAVARRTNAIVAVGTPGTRVSLDRGITWTTIDTTEYNAVQFAADGTGYAVGPRGRIARLMR